MIKSKANKIKRYSRTIIKGEKYYLEQEFASIVASLLKGESFSIEDIDMIIDNVCERLDITREYRKQKDECEEKDSLDILLKALEEEKDEENTEKETEYNDSLSTIFNELLSDKEDGNNENGRDDETEKVSLDEYEAEKNFSDLLSLLVETFESPEQRITRKNAVANAKYKAGDKVKVRMDLEQNKSYGKNVFYGNSMEELKGKECEIKEVEYSHSHECCFYTLKECTKMKWWTEEMFELNNDKPKKAGRPRKTKKKE